MAEEKQRAPRVRKQETETGTAAGKATAKPKKATRSTTVGITSAVRRLVLLCAWCSWAATAAYSCDAHDH